MDTSSNSTGSPMQDCIFCKIARGVVPVALEHQDEQCMAFQDLNPQAPHHLLIIPREHLQSLAHCAAEHQSLLGHLLVVAGRLAEQLGSAGEGYRLVTNVGSHGGQSVPHLHFHLLAGRPMSWPPG